MVRFFNQKEEVINIELTPYGKEQFSKGVFSPAYYAFYDSSVIYDGEYANITETQNQVTNRIANETPKLQPNTKFTSIVGSVYSLLTANDQDALAQNVSSSAPFIRTLGSSDPNSTFLPAWSVEVLDLSDVGLNEGVIYKMDNTIPQMSATLFIDYEETEIEGQDQGIYNLIASDTLFLDVQELNTIFKSNGNFDIEVYASGTSGIQSLGFINRESQDSDNLSSQVDPYVLSNTINGSNQEIVQGFPILDQTYVEFYLDISTDSEISFIRTPSNSDLYKRNIDSTPQDPCDTLDTLPGGYDIS
jgi:hypothetical protein